MKDTDTDSDSRTERQNEILRLLGALEKEVDSGVLTASDAARKSAVLMEEFQSLNAPPPVQSARPRDVRKLYLLFVSIAVVVLVAFAVYRLVFAA